jgi:hypothetical protein
MSEAVAKPWLQTTSAGVIAAAEKLKHENPQDLFLLLTRAAASADWDIFVPAFEQVSKIKGIKLLLPAPDGFAMRYAYECANLPPDGWPVFIGVLESVLAIKEERRGNIVNGKRLRELVVERTFAMPTVRELPFAGELLQLLAN